MDTATAARNYAVATQGPLLVAEAFLAGVEWVRDTATRQALESKDSSSETTWDRVTHD